MSQVLSGLSDALADTVQQASPYVVRVEARDRLPATGVAFAADGLIVTSHHVVERDDNITVGLPNGDKAAARLVGRDPTTDLALLKADGVALAPAPWATPDDLKVGHLVLALGRPGQTVLATLGIVSGLGNEWRTPAGGTVDRYLHTDVVMYPGFSGGPLVDVAGRVRGINTSGLLRGLSITVPTPTVRRVVQALQTHGHVQRGYLGVGAQPVRLPAAIASQVGQETGLLLASVEPGSPAELGGLHLGDTILTLNGQPTADVDDLLGALGGDVVGQSVPIRILRGGQLQDARVTIGQRS